MTMPGLKTRPTSACRSDRRRPALQVRRSELSENPVDQIGRVFVRQDPAARMMVAGDEPRDPVAAIGLIEQHDALVRAIRASEHVADLEADAEARPRRI